MLGPTQDTKPSYRDCNGLRVETTRNPIGVQRHFSPRRSPPQELDPSLKPNAFPYEEGVQRCLKSTWLSLWGGAMQNFGVRIGRFARLRLSSSRCRTRLAEDAWVAVNGFLDGRVTERPHVDPELIDDVRNIRVCLRKYDHDHKKVADCLAGRA